MSELQISQIIFISSGALSFLSAPFFSLLLIQRAEKWGAIDVPTDNRRMHARPVARIGGAAIFLAFLLGSIPFILLAPSFFSDSTRPLFLSAAFGGGVILIGGIADDIYKLSPWQKIIYQLLAALVAAAFGTFGESPVYVLGGVLFCVLLANSFNLIDGLDGLCSGVGAFSFLAVALTGGELLSILILSSLVGFLPLNMRPAKLFLGDEGAMLIGFWLSILSFDILKGPISIKNTLSLGLIFALPLFDTAFAVVRRVMQRKNPFSPDREHLHHRLVDGGLSHGKTSLLLVLLGGGSSLLGALIYTVGFSPVCLILSSLLIFSVAFVIIISMKKSHAEKKDGKIYEKG